MKIPHVINRNAITVYTPSNASLALIRESLRTLIAEDFTWDDELCPALLQCTIESIAKYFEEKTIYKELPCLEKQQLIHGLPLDLPLEFVIPLIFNDHYWERRYKEEFKFDRRPKVDNWTWKMLYLERHCQKLVEKAKPQYEEESSMDEILDLCNHYITRLYVEQLEPWRPPLTMEKEDIPEVWIRDHISFKPIFKKLNRLEEVDIIFGKKNVGEDFDWNMFHVTVPDCERLAKALPELKQLRILRVHRSKIQYPHSQALTKGLIKLKRLEILDLSHCDLSDKGAMCIAFFLNSGTNLKELNLTNNQISKLGAEAIGFAICEGKCPELYELNLRLNPLGTGGALGIMSCLVRSEVPKKVSFAACLFEDDTPLKVCTMVKLVEALKVLDISSNYFGEKMGDLLIENLVNNSSLEEIDSRECDITNAQRQRIDDLLKRNRIENSIPKVLVVDTGEVIHDVGFSEISPVTFGAGLID